MASPAMLKTVRYHGYARFTLNVHCIHPPVMAISIAGPVPSSSSAIKSAAYDTDSVDPLDSGSGRLTFQADVTQENTRSAANSNGRSGSPGNDVVRTSAPAAMTNPTYHCAPSGSARQPSGSRDARRAYLAVNALRPPTTRADAAVDMCVSFRSRAASSRVRS
jgi:hypothetical protein